jgi:hypothetical protein
MCVVLHTTDELSLSQWSSHLALDNCLKKNPLIHQKRTLLNLQFLILENKHEL